MTAERTPLAEHGRHGFKVMGAVEVNYTLDDDQLLSIWTVITCLGLIKEIPDPAYGSKLLTQAQVLLTALVLQLSPLAEDRSNPVTVGPG